MTTFARYCAVILVALTLAGCAAKPITDTTADSHDTTRQVTQADNRPLCIGLLNLGSCNVTQDVTQNETPDLAVGKTKGLEPGTYILLLAGLGCLALLPAAIAYDHRQNEATVGEGR